MIEFLNNDSSEKITRSIFESIHAAYASNSYQSLIDINLSTKMREELTAVVFEEAIEKYYSKYGDLLEITYLGYLNRNVGHQTLWKCKYDQNSEEVLWHVFFSKDSTEELEVTGIWFGY